MIDLSYKIATILASVRYCVVAVGKSGNTEIFELENLETVRVCVVE